MSVLPTSEAHALSLRRLWLADLSLLSVAFIWGVNIPVMKVALELGITPYALNAVRLIISAVVLAACATWEFRRGVRPTSDLSRWRVVVYAMVVSVAYQYLFLMAVSRTTSANIALIMATVPMWTALAARGFLKEILPPLAWTGLIIAFAGTMIVTVQRPEAVQQKALIAVSSVDSRLPRIVAETPRSPGDAAAETPTPTQNTAKQNEIAQKKAAETTFAGNLIALLAALTWAGGTVFSRPLLRTISPVQLAACSATLGLPFHLLIALPAMQATLPLLHHLPLQLCILYSGILSTGLALAMWSYGVKHAGAAQATMFQNLSPIIAIGAAWLWRGELVSVPQLIGGAMILGGLIVMRKSRTAV